MREKYCIGIVNQDNLKQHGNAAEAGEIFRGNYNVMSIKIINAL